ncbi:DNA-directed RNA polymerase, mitochondrial, partial [Zancudomyces culisetae]
MQKEYGITPNYNTFALLIKGYMRSRLDNVVKLLVEEFEKQGNKVEQLVLSPYLSDEEFDRLESITSGKFKNRMGVLNDIALETFLDQGSNNTNELQELKEAEQSVRKEQERMNIGNMNEKQNDTATHNKDGLLKDAESDTLGIKMLKRMLNPLEEGELTDYEKQLRLEHEANEASAHRYEVETSSYRDGELQKRRPAIQKYVSEWIPQVVEQIEAELALCKDEGLMLTPEDRERAVYAPFLRLLPPEQIANITIMETFRMVMARSNVRDNMIPDGSAKMTRVIMTLGTALRTQYHMMELQKKKNSHLLQRGLDLQGLSVSGKLFNMAVRKAQSKVEAGLAKSDWVGEWPRATTVKLGAMLVGILLKVAKIEVTELNEETGQTERKKVPAFEHSFWLSNGYRHGIIKMHLELTSIMARSSYTRILSARHLPMIVPPKPWLSYNIGGYLSFSSLCMRIHNNVEHQKYIKHLSEQGKLGTVLAGLDVLGLTKWAINKRVFTVVRDVWNSGKSLADIPPLELTESEPQRKFAVDVIPAEKFATLSEEQKTTEQQRLDAQYRQAVTDYRRKKANNHSLRCDVNYKVEIAQAFLDRPMYFPHNFDFRGRAYPLPPFFNQMGNDLCRGLITFYDGKKLGARGMFWLKVHLANTYGFDKFSHTDRVKFCDDNWDNIRDSALHPLDG